MSDAVAEAARAAADDAGEVLAAWARQGSGSHDAQGLEAMLELVSARAARLPGEQRRVRLGYGGPAALSVSCRASAPFRVLLVGHYDTVHGPDAPGPPVATRADGALTGPGVADMKGGILVMIAALEGLEASPAAARLGWRLLLTPDEELGAPLSRDLLVRAAGRAHVGLVFEPAPAVGAVVVARRGRRVLGVEVRGRAAHAGRDPASGRNAVTALAQVLLAAEALGDPASGTDVTVGLASGGTAVNVVPHLATARIDVRATDAAALDRVERDLGIAASAAAAARGVDIEVSALIGCPPMPATDRARALAALFGECMARSGCTAEPREVGGVSDANHLAGAGLTVLDGLGPVGGGLHGPDEWVDVAGIPARAAAAALLLDRLARDRRW